MCQFLSISVYYHKLMAFHYFSAMEKCTKWTIQRTNTIFDGIVVCIECKDKQLKHEHTCYCAKRIRKFVSCSTYTLQFHTHTQSTIKCSSCVGFGTVCDALPVCTSHFLCSIFNFLAKAHFILIFIQRTSLPMACNWVCSFKLWRKNKRNHWNPCLIGARIIWNDVNVPELLVASRCCGFGRESVFVCDEALAAERRKIGRQTTKVSFHIVESFPPNGV